MGKHKRSVEGQQKQLANKADMIGRKIALHVIAQAIERKDERAGRAAFTTAKWKRASTSAECARGAAWIANLRNPEYSADWAEYATNQQYGHGSPAKPDVGSRDRTFESSSATNGSEERVCNDPN